MSTQGGSEPRRIDSGLTNFEAELRAVSPEDTIDFLARPVNRDDPEDLDAITYPAYAVSKRNRHALEVMLKRLREINADLSDSAFAGLLNSAIDLAEKTDPILDLLLANLDLLGPEHAFQVLNDSEQNSFHHAALRPAALSVFNAFKEDDRIRAGLMAGNKDGLTPLHHAVKADNTGAVVRTIVELCPESTTSTDKVQQNTPLHYLLRTFALTNRHVNCAKYLIDEERVTAVQLRECLTMRDKTRHSVMSLLDSMTNPQENPTLPPPRKPPPASLQFARKIQEMVQEVLLRSEFSAEDLRTAYYGDSQYAPCLEPVSQTLRVPAYLG